MSPSEYANFSPTVLPSHRDQVLGARLVYAWLVYFVYVQLYSPTTRYQADNGVFYRTYPPQVHLYPIAPMPHGSDIFARAGVNWAATSDFRVPLVRPDDAL